MCQHMAFLFHWHAHREALGEQLAGFQQEWFGRMHRIDKFFHRVKPPPGIKMDTHKGKTNHQRIHSGVQNKAGLCIRPLNYTNQAGKHRMSTSR